MIRRNRILRQFASIRSMVQETILKPSDFILPVFIEEGENVKIEIPTMPGYYRYSIDLAVTELQECFAMGIKSTLIFASTSTVLSFTISWPSTIPS